MRGLAVLIMIQCHIFNSFIRKDLSEAGPYVLSQFVGGMAAPLFLFMAGMTLAFQMDSLERREPAPLRRWLISLRRGVYILGIAFAFRLSNFIASLPHADPNEIIKVDILNCMGVGMAALAVASVFDGRGRARFAAAAGLVIAVAAPLVANANWEQAPVLLRHYVAAEPGLGRFAFFPCAAYVAFGLAAGTVVRRTAADRIDRLMQWSVLMGLALVLPAQYFSNGPYSIYPKSDFWIDGPALVLIRAGISLLLMSGSYLWTEYCAGAGWSWVQTLGKNSLMVYWVHVMLVYGDIIKGFKHSLAVPETLLATLTVILLMLGLSVAWLWWKAHRVRRGNLMPATGPAAYEMMPPRR